MLASDLEYNLKSVLETLPLVVSVGEVRIIDLLIKHINILTDTVGQVMARQLETYDAPALFEFYTLGLGELPRRLFAPYPLFHTPPVSASELAERIGGWQKETDWTAVNLVKGQRIIGFCVLKRFRTEQVTSGIAVSDEFVKLGLGYLMQTIIVEQARLLGVRKFHVKIVSDNLSSLRLHEKCGFKQTRILSQPMYEDILKYLDECDRKGGRERKERRIVEMVAELEHEKD